MPQANVYAGFEAPKPNQRSIGETVQIVLLGAIIVVFGVIAASSTVGLLVSSMHR